MLFFQCGVKDDCAPNTVSSLIVRQNLKDFFPYKPQQDIVFEKYIDSTKIGDVIFTTDTLSFIEHRNHTIDCRKGMGMSYHEVYSEHFLYKLVNQTEPNFDCNLEFIGEFKMGSAETNYDNTSLNIHIYDYKNSIYSLSELIKDDSSIFWLDSLVINGKNYGKTICYNPNWTKRIYFNSTHGIIMYLDESKKIKLILK